MKGNAVPHKRQHTATVCATSEVGTDRTFGAVIPPLYLSSTYLFDGLDGEGMYDYGRGGNPNRDALARTLATLEHGVGSVITSSGMAAIDLVLNLVNADDLIIAPHDCYGGTHRLLTHREKQGRLKVRFIDLSDEKQVAQALSETPAMLLIETPSNPLMRIFDIRKLCNAARDARVIVVCDNTFLSPARQTPLTLGADIVVHSTTKYLNGHSDVVGGAAVAKTEECAEALAWWANCTGVTGAPFDSFLTLRGLRTLDARMDVQERNTIAIAEFLDTHPKVSKVYYPGLESDSGYQLAQKQQTGPGAMLSFELDTDRDGITACVKNPGLFQLAESLGGTESLISHPASMTHRAMEPEARARAGIGENLLRISVGLEHSEDQLRDLKTMLLALERT